MIPKINVLNTKANVNSNDLLLIEDSADNYSKKKSLVSSFGGNGNELIFELGEPMSAGSVVSLSSDGKIYLLNLNNRYNYIGILKETGSQMEFKRVVIYGGVYTGLTVEVGKTYYIQDNGSIDTTMTDLVAYKALSNNSVLVLY